jgi:hypothetical protein
VKKWKASPLPLIITAIIFGIAPLWALAFMHRPWDLFQTVDHWKGPALVFNFWIGPFALALCAITRHKFLIPLFVVESCTMLLLSMFNLTASSPELITLQLVLIGGMVFFALFLIQTDAMHPLLHGAARPWRSQPRIQLGLRATLTSPDRPDSVKVTVQDCSADGMQLIGKAKDLKTISAGWKKRDHIEFTLKFDQEYFPFSASIAWSAVEDEEQRLGLRIASRPSMEAFIAALPAEDDGSENVLSELFNHYWQKKPVRQAAISIWTILILAVLVIPSIKKHPPLRSRAGMAHSDYIKAGMGPLPMPMPNK